MEFQRVSLAVAAQKKDYDLLWVVEVKDKKIVPSGVGLILARGATIQGGSRSNFAKPSPGQGL